MAKRRTYWIDNRIDMTIATGAAATTTMFENNPPIDIRGHTVIREVIDLYAHSNTVAGAFGTQVLDIAMGIASQEAFNAGVFPDPSTENDRPARGWLMRCCMVPSQNGVGTPITTRYQLDNRSARKILDGELYLTVNSTAGIGTSFTSRIFGLVRILMMAD